jgi:hypothetical protein
MLKFLFKTIIFVIILFGVGQYSSYLLTGKTPDITFKKPTLPDINMSDLNVDNIKDKLSNKFDSVSNKFNSIKDEKFTSETYLYKWRDNKGVIHYASDKPTGEIKNLEAIKISSKTIVVRAVQSSDTSTRERQQQQTQRQSPTTELPTNVYSPEGIKQLFEQAKNVQNLVNDQFSKTEKLSNEN